ncbi:DUF3298 and DUF4163 domain-containing protein [Aneurinibacillus uraniidurans]|uniref:DUF3298 and DUF4163 domain-containing protein n=1 Tax=Aneurinibacillus uraniidurans TaxID=2966586 RepID=UPI00234A34D8|nr:DUF3298 and DUF4163 domain-containing protein [Aneurinibacillus sp. B1]WCN36392.1 DUF3298 and DUF4163 domain-containing protein [Aneurinibacillus sp. B1]
MGNKWYSALHIGVIASIVVGGSATGLLIPASSAYATQSVAKQKQTEAVKVTTKHVSSKTPDLHLDMKIPIVSGLKDKKYEAQLNDILLRNAMKSKEVMEKEAEEYAADAKENGWPLTPYELLADYKVKQTGSILSLAISQYEFTGGAHGNSDTTYYNIVNKPNTKSVQLADLFKPGVGYKSIINKEISKQIQAKKNEADWYTFTSISDAQSFSLEKGKIIIHFGSYEIAPYAAGQPEFAIPVAKLKNSLKPEFFALLK